MNTSPSSNTPPSPLSTSAQARKSTSLALLLLWSGFSAFGQSWVSTPGSALPNDTVASTYYPYHATKTSNVKYGSHNSSEVGDIYVPNYSGNPIPANSTHRPAIVVVHGGGGTSGNRTGTREIQTSELFAAHGYVAFNIDYAIGAVYPKNILDWRLAVRYLRANAATYGIDPDHIGITGGSFGGYCSALMSGIHDGQKTGADTNSAYNNVSLDVYSGEALNTYSGDVQAVMDFYGPTTLSTAHGNALGQFSGATTSTYKWASPTNYVSGPSNVNNTPISAGGCGGKFSVPTMISYGTSDSTVAPSENTIFYNDLVAAGVTALKTTIPGGQHTFCIWDSTKGGTWPTSGPLSHSGTIDLRQDAAVFFDTYLLAAPTGPVAVNDAATTSNGVAVTIPVLANDSDPNNAPLSIQSVTQGSRGVSAISGTNVTYSPSNMNFVGSDSFNYTITNGTSTASATVNVTLTATNLAPVAVNDSATTPNNASVSIHVLANDSDPNSNAISIQSVGAVTSGSGTAVISGTNISFTPTSGFIGTAIFPYTITDGSLTATANVNVNVTAPANLPPVAVNDSATTAMNTPVTIHALANDSDPNGDPISIQSVGAATSGTAVISGTDVVYTPNNGFSGTDKFTYTITDGSLTATGTDTVIVSSGTGTSSQTVNYSAAATILSGTSAGVDVNEATTGYLQVKYNLALTSARKVYFQFDVSLLAVDPTGTATFTASFLNTYQQNVQLWGLNQSYPGFSSVLTWNGAQANDTASNNMLTSGAASATAIGSPVFIPTSGTNPYSFSIPAIGQYVQGGKVTLVLTGVDITSGTNNSSGLRMILNGETLQVPTTNGINTPPSITSITNRTISPSTSTGAIQFTVNDAETAAASLTVTGSSSNTTLVPNNNIVLGGTAGSRTVTVTPMPALTGTTAITLTVSDGSLSTSGTFLLTVSAAQTMSVPVTTLATIESGTSATVDIDEAVKGYVSTKYSSALTSERKAYFQFDVSSLNLVAQSTGTFTVQPTATYQGNVQLWALNQPYGTFDSHITWNTAQANDTSGHSMLATGSFTASTIGSPMLVPTSGTSAFSISIPNIGNYVQGGKVTLVLTEVDATGTNQANGLRMSLTGETLTVQKNLNAPTIDQINDQNIPANSSVMVSFNVGDAESPASSLVVTGSADNMLVAVSLSGTGSSRSVTLTPAANKAFGATVTLNVSDGSLTTTVTFFLTVGTTLESWWFQNFGTTNYSSGAFGFNADTDHDGLSNMLEFALEADPNASDAWTPWETLTAGTTIGLDAFNNPLRINKDLPITHVPVTYYDGTYVYLIYRKAASGSLNYEVQATYTLTDPSSWTTIGGTIGGIPTASEYNINDVTYAVKYPWNSLTDPPIFLRLMVTPY